MTINPIDVKLYLHFKFSFADSNHCVYLQCYIIIDTDKFEIELKVFKPMNARNISV